VPEVCKLEAQISRQKKELFLIILSALSFQPKLQRAAHLIQEIVQEKTERE
jgi:hypothetical protein